MIDMETVVVLEVVNIEPEYDSFVDRWIVHFKHDDEHGNEYRRRHKFFSYERAKELKAGDIIRIDISGSVPLNPNRIH